MNRNSVFILLAIMFFGAGCTINQSTTPTPDVNAIYTSAASTVIAELTQTAVFFTPTYEPTSTPTPIPATPTLPVTSTPGATTVIADCDDAKFLSDVNIPDGTKLAPGQDFIKTWHIQNTGTCTWNTGYGLVYGGYTVKMDGIPAVLSQSVPPDGEVDVSVQFKAPAQPGEYISYWRMKNSQEYPFGEFFYVKIIVE